MAEKLKLTCDELLAVLDCLNERNEKKHAKRMKDWRVRKAFQNSLVLSDFIEQAAAMIRELEKGPTSSWDELDVTGGYPRMCCHKCAHMADKPYKYCPNCGAKMAGKTIG